MSKMASKIKTLEFASKLTKVFKHKPIAKIKLAKELPKPQSFGALLRNLKRMVGVTGETIENAVQTLKTANTGFKKFDDIFSDLPVTKKNGIIKMADTPVGAVHKLAASADLDGLIKLSKKNIPITAVDKVNFKNLAGDTPELAFKEVDDAAAAAKRNRPNLDVTPEKMGDLSDGAKADIKKIEFNLSKKFQAGVKIALVIGFIYVAVDWIKTATEYRKGCFMLTTIDGKTVSCKVEKYSCIGNGGEFCSTVPEAYNTTLSLMAIAAQANTSETKIALATAVGYPVDKIHDSLAKIIDEKFEQADNFISALTSKPVFNICGITHPDIDEGKVPPCRMCSTSANPISTTFINMADLADNVTFQCVENPSILDTIIDAAIETGEDLWDGLGSPLFDSLKKIAIIGAIILGFVFLLSLVVKTIGNRNNNQNQNSNNQSPNNNNQNQITPQYQNQIAPQYPNQYQPQQYQPQNFMKSQNQNIPQNYPRYPPMYPMA